jgi:hypothetical protein
MSDLRMIEMSFAYERAAGVIESECVPQGSNCYGDMWFDLASATVDLTDEVLYLDSRRLLERSLENPQWVIILDEGEPLCEPEPGA